MDFVPEGKGLQRWSVEDVMLAFFSDSHLVVGQGGEPLTVRADAVWRTACDLRHYAVLVAGACECHPASGSKKMLPAARHWASPLEGVWAA